MFNAKAVILFPLLVRDTSSWWPSLVLTLITEKLNVKQACGLSVWVVEVGVLYVQYKLNRLEI